jgi:hypothetical protein
MIRGPGIGSGAILPRRNSYNWRAKKKNIAGDFMHRRPDTVLGFALSRSIFFCVLLGVLASLQACGGGDSGGGGTTSTSSGSGGTGTGSGSGSGSGGSSGSSGSGGGAPVLSASSNVVNVTAAPTDPTPAPQVNLTLTNPPSGGTFWYSYSFTGSAVASANVVWSPQILTGTQSGHISITLLSPGLMGSGTFHDTVQVEVCTDSNCNQQIAGSPINVSVNYTVSGNAVSNAGYFITPTSLYFEAPTNGSVQPQTVAVTAYYLPPYGAYVKLSSSSGGPVGNLSFVQTSSSAEPYAYATGTLTVTMKAPLELGPGLYTDVVNLAICYDQACTKPAPQSPLQVQVTYLVTASAGHEFTQQVVSQNVSTLAANPAGTLLYATTYPCLANSGCTTPAQLISIDPASGSVTTLIANLSGTVQGLSVSQDGAYLYLLSGTSAWRVNTATWAIDQSVQVGSQGSTAGGIAISPVNSTTWAVSFSTQTGTTATSEVQIFDAATPRPNVWSDSNYTDIGVGALWSADGSTMYVVDQFRNLYSVPVSASGLGTQTALQTVPGAAFDPVDLQLVGGLLYSGTGKVLDPSTNTVIGSYPLPSGTPYAEMSVDPANNRVFASYNQSMPNGVVNTMESYDMSTFNPLWVARLPVGTGIRWGSQGLAWIGPGTGSAQSAVYIISGSFVAP